MNNVPVSNRQNLKRCKLAEIGITVVGCQNVLLANAEKLKFKRLGTALSEYDSVRLNAEYNHT